MSGFHLLLFESKLTTEFLQLQFQSLSSKYVGMSLFTERKIQSNPWQQDITTSKMAPALTHTFSIS